MKIGKKEIKDFRELMGFLGKGFFFILGFTFLVIIGYLFLFSFRQEDQMGAFMNSLKLLFQG